MPKEITFDTAARKELQAGVDALAMVRAWRFLRIGHGLGTSVHEANHEHAKELEEQEKDTQKKLERAAKLIGGLGAERAEKRHRLLQQCERKLGRRTTLPGSACVRVFMRSCVRACVHAFVRAFELLCE